MTVRIVAALGGNALLDPERPPEYSNQFENIRSTAGELARLLEDGHELVLTHGNGPQAGNILLQQEKAPPAMPLDVVVAETQGQIGYMLQRELGKQVERPPVTVLTQVVVDEDSDAFDDPTKPVGPFYTEEEAQDAPGTVKKVGSGDRAYRRVVPSPPPQSIREEDAIASLLEEEGLVIAAGGGGIPVTADGDGVEAVIDKDRTASLLARTIGADILLILTDVDHVFRDYGTDDEEQIGEMTVREARELADAGEFGEGSMEPKVRAAATFADETGNRAVITSLDNIEAALEGYGTVIR